MSYLPFRDNKELESTPEDQVVALGLLADDLEQAARQEWHRDACMCQEGSERFWECRYGPKFPSVDAQEILGLALARGYLTLPSN